MSAVLDAVECHLLTETTLGALAEYITSGSRDWSKYYAASGAIFIRTQDINQNRLSLDDVAYVHLPAKVEGKRSLVRKGDLLITITGANVGKVAVVEQDLPEAYVSQSVCLVRLKEPSLAKFLQLQLIARHGEKSALEAMAYGLGRPVLNLENVRAAPVKVGPPRIRAETVAEIEKQFSRLDGAVASLKRVQANLKHYKAAVLREAIDGTLIKSLPKASWEHKLGVDLVRQILSDRAVTRTKKDKGAPVEVDDITRLPVLPVDWAWATLDQIGQEGRPVIYGIIKPGPDTPCGVPYVRVTEMKDGFVDLPNLRRAAREREAKFSRARLLAGDLLISKDGTIGRVAVVPPQLEGGNITQHVMRAPVHRLMNRDFVVWAIRSELCQRWLTGETRGVALRGVNVEDFRRLPIPVPPRDEQDFIVAEVDRRLSIVREVEAEVDANLKRAQALRQAVLAHAFGEVGAHA